MRQRNIPLFAQRLLASHEIKIRKHYRSRRDSRSGRPMVYIDKPAPKRCVPIRKYMGYEDVYQEAYWKITRGVTKILREKTMS